ncbi:hypothetical protein D3C75_1110560 [compost metagenome]
MASNGKVPSSMLLSSGCSIKLDRAILMGMMSLIGRSKAITVAKCPGWLKVVRIENE